MFSPAESQLMAGSPIAMSVTDQLVSRKKSLEDQLSKVNEALDMLTKHPETQAVLDTLARLGVR